MARIQLHLEKCFYRCDNIPNCNTFCSNNGYFAGYCNPNIINVLICCCYNVENDKIVT